MLKTKIKISSLKLKIKNTYEKKQILKKCLHKTIKQYKHTTVQTQYLEVTAVYKCKLHQYTFAFGSFISYALMNRVS